MNVSDDTLVAQVVQLQDKSAFAELIRRYQGKILLLQKGLTKNTALAEDLTQETFFRAWQKIGTYKNSGRFAGWLARLSYRVFLQHRRARKTKPTEVPLETPDMLGASPPSPTSDLERMLSVLDEDNRILFVLTYAYGMSNTEVAEALETPVGTIKARISRGKAKIRAWIEHKTPKETEQTPNVSQQYG